MKAANRVRITYTLHTNQAFHCAFFCPLDYETSVNIAIKRRRSQSEVTSQFAPRDSAESSALLRQDDGCAEETAVSRGGEGDRARSCGGGVGGDGQPGLEIGGGLDEVGEIGLADKRGLQMSRGVRWG